MFVHICCIWRKKKSIVLLLLNHLNSVYSSFFPVWSKAIGNRSRCLWKKEFIMDSHWRLFNFVPVHYVFQSEYFYFTWTNFIFGLRISFSQKMCLIFLTITFQKTWSEIPSGSISVINFDNYASIWHSVNFYSVREINNCLWVKQFVDLKFTWIKNKASKLLVVNRELGSVSLSKIIKIM